MIDNMIEYNILKSKEIIQNACFSVGRNIEDIEVVLASKNHSIETLEFVCKNYNYHIFAENKVQEFMNKYSNKFIWDFIGQLQTNKVKYIIDKVRFIQSVDRKVLCDEIQKRSYAIKKTQEIFIQINAGEEASKGGVCFNELEDFVQLITDNYSNILIKGIMIVTPKNISDSETRKYFAKSYSIFQSVKNRNKDIQYLSMGMSSNYDLAILEGANMIRLGTAILGART